jgi:putative DNA primase/helicase
MMDATPTIDPIDYESIKALAAASERPANTLIAMSYSSDPFYVMPYRQAAAEWFAALWREHCQGRPQMHIRGIHYLLISLANPPNDPRRGKPYTNTDRCHSDLCNASRDARLLRLVPFERIVDERNDVPVEHLPNYAETDGPASLAISDEPVELDIESLDAIDDTTPALLDEPIRPLRVLGLTDPPDLIEMPAEIEAPDAPDVDVEVDIDVGVSLRPPRVTPPWFHIELWCEKLEAKAERDFKDAQGAHALNEKIAALQAKEALKKAAKLINEKSSSEKIQRARDLLAESPTSSEPTRRRYITNDTNIASLGVLLQQNPNGLLVFRDEIVSLLRGLDHEERASERGFYLTGWNGNSSYTFDRIGRGLHLTVESVCLSMLGSAQPGTIADYLAQAIRGGRGADGLIQRFGLLVGPDWKFVDRSPSKHAREANFEVFDYLDKLDWRAVNANRDIGFDGDEEGMPFLRFNIDAYDAFVIWMADLERRLRGPDLHHALESHLAKYRKLVPTLALICHLADGGIGPVGVPALERAIAWARYLETHASRAYGSTKTVEAATARAILAKLHSGHLRSPFNSRDVWRPGWSQLTDSAAVQAGLKMLSDYDWLTQRKVATAGRDATIYMVNPKAMKMHPGR